MTKEISALEKNNTWTVETLPPIEQEKSRKLVLAQTMVGPW